MSRVVPPLLTVLVALVGWQWYATTARVSPQVLPSPLRVVEQGWVFRDQILTHTLATLEVTAVGFAVSLSLSFAIATVVDFTPWLRRALTPLLVASQTLPIIAIAPLLIITQLEEYDYAGAASIATVMLIVSFAMLMVLNLLQHWQRRRSAA